MHPHKLSLAFNLLLEDLGTRSTFSFQNAVSVFDMLHQTFARSKGKHVL